MTFFAAPPDELLPNATYVAKLAYCELFAHQSAIAINRAVRKAQTNKRALRVKKHNLIDKFYDILPFKLTNAQQRTLDEIFADFNRPTPMMRLTQGDVGSGKTMVAFGSAVKMAETGAQSVLLAPTDTLAQQHFEKLKPMCDKCKVIRRKGKVRVICENPKHKQVQG